MEVYSEEEESDSEGWDCSWVIRTRACYPDGDDPCNVYRPRTYCPLGMGRVAQEERVTRVLSILLGAARLWFYRVAEPDDPCNVLKSTDLGCPA